MINVARSDVLAFKFKELKMWIEIDFVNLNPLKPKLSPVRFVFDTGVVGILLSREMFDSLGYSELPYIRRVRIGGVTGHQVSGKEYRIPGFRIAGKFQVEEPIVRVPDKANGCRNLLGQSVLRTRNFCVDNEVNLIYFGHKNSHNRTITHDFLLEERKDNDTGT